MRDAFKSILAALALSMSLVAIAVAGPFEDGLEAYNRGDMQTALRLWKPLIEQGNARVQTYRGIMYHQGYDRPVSYVEAVRWFRKAAEQGDAGGQHWLGLMYYEGHGVPQDFLQAHMWFNLAAAQGREPAAYFRDSVAEKMTPDQIVEAQRLAREWKSNEPDLLQRLRTFFGF